MQRRPRTYVISAALAVTLTGGLAGCSGSSGDETGEDTKPGTTGSSASSAAPGRYNTLPEPCGSVSTGTLKKLLPGADSADSGSGAASGEHAESPYEGKAKLTYDTDRRVGCNWKAASPAGTRHLSVDMERVVSYDPSVSDDEQAELLYDERAGQAEIPSSDAPSPKQSAPGGTASPSPSESSGSASQQPGSTGASPSTQKQGAQEQGTQKQQGGENAQGGRQRAAAPSASASPTQSGAPSAKPTNGQSGGTQPSGQQSDGADGASPTGSPSSGSASQGPDLSPRTLDDIGDSAYIDDQLDTANSGVHRDITLVFRSSNVIATVRYDQWVTDKNHLPDSAELQGNARAVARELAAHFDEE